MKIIAAIFSVILISSAFAESDSWAWNAKEESAAERRSDENIKTDEKVATDSQGRHIYNVQEIYSNDTSIDEIIDTILHKSREGRNLDEYSEISTDPNVLEAIQNGDNVQARNLIREKLCTLGLMQCELTEEKRPFRNGIYAQGPLRPPYGPPKPMPPIPGHAMIPPRKVGYEGPILSKPFLNNLPGPVYGGPGPVYEKPGPSYNGPSYNGPYLESPPSSSFISGSSTTFSKPPPGAIIYGSKPPGPVYEGIDAPYDFEHIVGDKIQVEHSQSFDHHQFSSQNGFTGKPTIVVNAQGGTAATAGTPTAALSASALQQHVHHHFHHVDSAGNKAPPVPLTTGNGINSEFATIASSTGGFAPLSGGYDIKNEVGHGVSDISSFSQAGLISGNTVGAFSGVNGGIRPVNNLYSKPSTESGLGSYGSGFLNSYGSSSSSFAGSGYGSLGSGVYNPNTASYHTSNPDYFKKDLTNVNGGNQFNSLSGYGNQNKYNSQQYGGQFSQYSGVDDYNALETSRQHSIDCVCVPINQCPAADRIGRKEDLILPIDPRNLGSDLEALPEDGNSTTANNSEDLKKDESKEKKISKREIAGKKVSEEADEYQSDIQPRLTISNNIPQTSISLQKKKVVPTFGVSFGLPYPTGIYPFNPYGGHPAQNPYFGSISPNGLNLGLLNVNPLLSLQVTKDDHGEKVVKPLVNFHVTPNEQLIHKVGSIFKAKKDLIFNQHEHFHHHSHYRPHPEIYFPEHPPYHHHSGPIYPHEPIIHHEPHHSFHHPGNFGGNYGLEHPPHSYGIFRSEPTGPEYDHQPYFDSHGFYERSYNVKNLSRGYANDYQYDETNRFGKKIRFDGPSNVIQVTPTQVPGDSPGSKHISFPNYRRKRSTNEQEIQEINGKLVRNNIKKRQALYGGRPQQCNAGLVCCRRPFHPQQQQQQQQLGRCGTRNAHGITGRIKNPVYVDGDSEFGEYPWQAAILKKDPKESVYVCGGTIIDQLHIITAAHCVKTFAGFDLRVRLGEWDVNHDVEFFPYIERDVVSVHVHPEYYAGTLDNDLAILKLDQPIDFTKSPHISPACLPDKYSDFTGARCWTTGWGKDAFGDYGKYQNILKEVDIPVLSQQQCQNQLRNTRLGYNYRLHPGFICAGGEEGKDACKGDGGGPMVCEKNGFWHIVGVVSWGIGCGQVNVPGVYVRVSYYLDWINQITRNY